MAFRGKFGRLAVVPVWALVLVGTVAGSGGVAVAGTHIPGTQSGGAATKVPGERVIVVLKDQLAATPDTRAAGAARRSAAGTAEAGVVGRLTAAKATRVHQFTLLDAVSATVGSAEARQLASDPEVAEVVPDATVRMADSPTIRTTAATTSAHRTPVRPANPLP